jgi:hypothetical protein
MDAHSALAGWAFFLLCSVGVFYIGLKELDSRSFSGFKPPEAIDLAAVFCSLA